MMLAAAAASGARFWPSVAGMLLGTLPGTFLMVQFGSGLAQGRTVMTVVSAVGLVLSFVLGGFLGRRVYKELNAVQQVAEELKAEASARRGFVPPRKEGLPRRRERRGSVHLGQPVACLRGTPRRPGRSACATESW